MFSHWLQPNQAPRKMKSLKESFANFEFGEHHIKKKLQSNLNAAASPMVKPTDGRPMCPAPIGGGQGLLSSTTGQCQSVGRGEKKSWME